MLPLIINCAADNMAQVQPHMIYVIGYYYAGPWYERPYRIRQFGPYYVFPADLLEFVLSYNPPRDLRIPNSRAHPMGFIIV